MPGATMFAEFESLVHKPKVTIEASFETTLCDFQYDGTKYDGTTPGKVGKLETKMADWTTYSNWCKESMAVRVSASLEVVDLPMNNERGIFATKPIDAGEVIVEVEPQQRTH